MEEVRRSACGRGGGRERGRGGEGGGEGNREVTNILATEPNIRSRTPVVHAYSSVLFLEHSQ